MSHAWLWSASPILMVAEETNSSQARDLALEGWVFLNMSPPGGHPSLTFRPLESLNPKEGDAPRGW